MLWTRKWRGCTGRTKRQRACACSAGELLHVIHFVRCRVRPEELEQVLTEQQKIKHQLKAMYVGLPCVQPRSALSKNVNRNTRFEDWSVNVDVAVNGLKTRLQLLSL
jgi:hypothetical protein